ncbi:MAG: porin [Burkholderiales bacterium]
MRKKLLAVAVAGAFTLPGVALAQSNVTISGYVHMSVDNLKINQPAAGRTTTSESRLNDESSSAVIFSVREDLGGGNAALVRVDVKINPDTSAIAASGESYVGLSIHNAGRFTAGRHNLHFFKTFPDAWFQGVTLRVHPSSIIDFAGGGVVAIANATRTPNSLRWSSPNWGGFAADVAYSFNPLSGSEADLSATNTARKGRAWNLNPAYTGNNWLIAYSYWNAKNDAPALATVTGATAPSAAHQLAIADQRSDTLYGWYTWDGFKVGLTWNKSKLNAAHTAPGLAATGTAIGNRTAWSLPISYKTGPHYFFASYTKAGDDKATAVADSAKMWGVTYMYNFSKRTMAGLSYGKITNDVGAAYSPYGDRGIGIGTVALTSGLGSVNSGAAPGEDYRTISFNIRHSY